jgi:non-ribosomal peptide synthetase component F
MNDTVMKRSRGVVMENNYSYWPKGVFKHPTYHEMPIYEGLRSSARQWPWRNAIIFGGMELTYAELDDLSDRFAAALADMGVRKGDRVAVHLPNCPQDRYRLLRSAKGGGGRKIPHFVGVHMGKERGLTWVSESRS